MGIGGINEMKYEYWFANLQGISNRRKMEIRGKVTNLEQLYNIEETGLKQLELNEKERKNLIKSIKEWDLDKEYQKFAESGIHFVPVTDSRYPKKLLDIDSAPYALYVKGKLPDENKMTVKLLEGMRDDEN